ncbi:NAD(P)H-binding protein [Thermophilibacter sp.]
MVDSVRGRALLLGGTGAMGSHLTRMLARDGWNVTVTSRSNRSSDNPRVSYVRGDAHDRRFLTDMLSQGWDVVVDFMVWSTDAFRGVCDSLLSSCRQYVFLSSYRVFADSPVIDERSPRLLDVSNDAGYLATDEYALAKARQEDLLKTSERGNWTIVRPAITYSVGRLQLCTLECGDWLTLALAGHAVPLPAEMLSRQTTMTWGGDVALMISRLVESKRALGEDYDVCTSRHQSWTEVVRIYRSLLPLEVRKVSLNAYERACGSPWQCRYDRMYNRVMDNSKVLAATGLTESDLADPADGLAAAAVDTLRRGTPTPAGMRRLGRLDRLGGGLFGPAAYMQVASASCTGYAKYLAGRLMG